MSGQSCTVSSNWGQCFLPAGEGPKGCRGKCKSVGTRGLVPDKVRRLVKPVAQVRTRCAQAGGSVDGAGGTVVPAGSVTAQCAEPLAPVTMVATDTEVMPGVPLKVIWAEKVPLVAVVVATVAAAPAPKGVAVIRVARPLMEGVTNPLT